MIRKQASSDVSLKVDGFIYTKPYMYYDGLISHQIESEISSEIWNTVWNYLQRNNPVKSTVIKVCDV